MTIAHIDFLVFQNFWSIHLDLFLEPITEPLCLHLCTNLGSHKDSIVKHCSVYPCFQTCTYTYFSSWTLGSVTHCLFDIATWISSGDLIFNIQASTQNSIFNFALFAKYHSILKVNIIKTIIFVSFFSLDTSPRIILSLVLVTFFI